MLHLKSPNFQGQVNRSRRLSHDFGMDPTRHSHKHVRIRSTSSSTNHESTRSGPTATSRDARWPPPRSLRRPCNSATKSVKLGGGFLLYYLPDTEEWNMDFTNEGYRDEIKLPAIF